MIFLYRQNTYSPTMFPLRVTLDEWRGLLEHPLVVPEKARAPLAIYGTMMEKFEFDDATGQARCIGANVKDLFALALDFDSGVTIDEFAERYAKFRWTLYTSYSYGFKEGDRFRVILPLDTLLPCELLQNRRVKANLAWHFQGVDQCCFDRGHWQILPAIRADGAPYRYMKNDGKLFMDHAVVEEYARWKAEDDAEFERRKLEAMASRAEVDPARLKADLEYELREVPVGAGCRYAEAKRLLAKYAHKGLGDAVLAVECPWTDQKWERRWQNMVKWAATIV